ncbi:Predicted ATPase [Solimonas aquatica]|uniref:Predicted ATPase n=1 Tax=Solimonas aquatica TaxID=489703 RepID=A0A1H9F984_9GAMM|nr:ATP-binding protein [Solimonas aquatica]SEQ34395.1 Predicted ATPase [Solimonas aquatica]
MSDVRITSIRFHNFKSLYNFSVALQEMNVLVGPNNAGKSTVISALRILEVALRRARAKNAERVRLPNGMIGFGHNISVSQLTVSLENVRTDYNEEDSRIEFRLSNRNKLYLYFPADGGCTLYWETEGAPVSTAGRFATAFPISVNVVPVLGPLEHREQLVTDETVRESLNTHRASRHFRNYWRYFPEHWQVFAEMISATWPGMTIKRPELDLGSRQLTMFVSENRIDREVYWAGFGFQIWCQLLTHISRAADATLVAVDEPEIYLHPDVQRQLLGILRSQSADVLLATHSVEIIGESDPSELLLIQKGRQSAQRLRDVEGLQLALHTIGSAHNVALAQLARTKKLLFVEGQDDFRTLRRFAKVLGYAELTAGTDVTAFESGGFTSWERVKSFAWGVRKTIDQRMKIFAIYDRDYFCKAHVDHILFELRKELTGAEILERKEMENHLLNIAVLQRAVDKQLSQRAKRSGTSAPILRSVQDYLTEITDSERLNTQSQYVAKELEFHQKSSIDKSTLHKQAMQEFEAKWDDIHQRMSIVPGKEVIRRLRERLQTDAGINLTDYQIVDEFEPEEVPADMKRLLAELEKFRLALID